MIEALLQKIGCLLENLLDFGFGEGEDGPAGSGDLPVAAQWQLLFNTSKPVIAQVQNIGATDVWLTDDSQDVTGGILLSGEAVVYDRYKGALYVRGTTSTVNWKIFKVH